MIYVLLPLVLFEMYRWYVYCAFSMIYLIQLSHENMVLVLIIIRGTVLECRVRRVMITEMSKLSFEKFNNTYSLLRYQSFIKTNIR